MNDSIDTVEPQPTPPNDKSSTYATILGISPLLAIFSASYLLNILAPLICWLIWKDQYPSVDKTGKNVLNSQISWFLWMTIISIISTPLIFLFFIGLVPIGLMFLLWLIFSIIQAVNIANGKTDYVMPFTLRLLK